MPSILSDINIQQIINFVTVAKQHGFQTASEQLHMTQSAVSKSISRLEETLGFPLFVKEHKGSRIFRDAELTSQGKYLYTYWAPALNDIENAYRHIISSNELEENTLNIAYTSTSDPNIYFWPLINRILEDTKDVKFNVDSNYRSELLQGLADEIYDLIFIPDIEYYSINQATMDFRYCSIDNAQIIVSRNNPLFDHSSLTVEDIKNEKFFIFDDNKSESPNKTITQFFQSVHISPPTKRIYRDAFNISNAYLNIDALTLVDSYYYLGPQAQLKRIPLEGFYNGILCVWKKNSSKRKKIKTILNFFPDLSKMKKGKLPIVRM